MSGKCGEADILIAAVDGLTGFPDAIIAVFPKTEVQLCIVHMVRNSLKYVPYKDGKAVTADLKEIYLHDLAKAQENRQIFFHGILLDYRHSLSCMPLSYLICWRFCVPYRAEYLHLPLAKVYFPAFSPFFT